MTNIQMKSRLDLHKVVLYIKTVVNIETVNQGSLNEAKMPSIQLTTRNKI